MARQPGALGAPNQATAHQMALFPQHQVKLCQLTNWKLMLQVWLLRWQVAQPTQGTKLSLSLSTMPLDFHLSTSRSLPQLKKLLKEKSSLKDMLQAWVIPSSITMLTMECLPPRCGELTALLVAKACPLLVLEVIIRMVLLRTKSGSSNPKQGQC
jgi:hypothetical protein